MSYPIVSPGCPCPAAMPIRPLTMQLACPTPLQHTHSIPIISVMTIMPVDDSHPYVPATPGDSRSPCPALNALANHGYM